MIPLAQFVPLFDYSQWELAIQAFFCDETQGGGLFIAPPDNSDVKREEWIPPAGQVVFMTGYQAKLFQSARPRVSLQPMTYTPMDTMVYDANGQLKFKSWHADLEFLVLTLPDYALHQTTLATVRAVVATMNPVLLPVAAIQSSGLNEFFVAAQSPFELAQIFDRGNSLETRITSGKDAFVTPYKVEAIFAINAGAWPGGLLNA